MININMSSNKSFSLLILFSLLLSLIFDSAALTSLKSCPSDCGGIEIPYPFGIGKGCYLEKWYEINCTSVSGKLVPFLSVVSKEVVKISLPGEFSWGSAPLSYGSVRIKNPITSKGCSSDDGEEQESRSLLNLTGSPFYVGYSNTLIAIGCDNMASLTHVEPSMVGCISSCLATNRTTTNRTTTSSKDYLALVDCNSKKNYEYCSQRSFKNETICKNGTGCCMANMPGSIQQVFGVRIATTGGGCKVAFLTDDAYSLLNETDLSGADPKQFHAKGYATVELGWFIHTTNPSFVESLRCTTMKEYRSLYVKSYETAHGINCSCDYNPNFPNHASCRCNKGYTGNSYIPGGCKDINECLEKDVDGNLWRCKGRKCVNLQGTYNCVNKNRRSLAATGVGSSFGSLIAAGGIYGLYKSISEGRRLRQKRKFFKRNGGLLLQQQLSSTEGNGETTRLFDSSELEKATENFNSNRILRRRQGTVYKGMLVDGRIVAAKKSKVVEEDKLEEFVNEVVNLSKINHRNVVKLLGCCLETDVPVLVNEFTPNGNLFELLHDEFDDNTMATWEVRLCIAVDVAGALSYLHSSTPSPIYHRDVKSENIMLDEKYRAKVSDFGILTVDHTDLTTVVSDTDGYMDPEYFKSKRYTDKSDVYSFGVVLAELITGEESIAQENMKLATYFILAMKENRLSNIIDARIRDGCKLNQVIAVAKIARKCLNLKGRNRPSMRQVSMELEKIRSSPGDMQPPEDDAGENDEGDEGVVDGNIEERSRNKGNVTAPASQYIVAASSSSWFDV